MPTKAWQCPSCKRDFIVADDAQRDVCPWCRTAVQDRSGTLEQAVPQPSSRAPETKARPAIPNSELWWPYEMDPF